MRKAKLTRCRHCQAPAPRGTPAGATPKGWKDIGGPVCDGCKKSRYVVRSVELPVAEPLDESWEETDARLAHSWEQSTAWANWASRTLTALDAVRRPGMTKLPPAPKVYLYGLAAKAGMAFGNASSRQSTFRSVEMRYRKRRFAVIWRREESPPGHRYPYPYPIHQKDWGFAVDADGRPVVTVPLAGRRVRLRLGGGPGFGRQYAALRQLAAGLASHGEAAVFRRKANRSDHRSGTEGRAPGGGRRTAYSVWVKMVLRLPKPLARERTGSLPVRTDAAALWVAGPEGSHLRVWNADHVRRWLAESRVYRQRMAEDLKLEKRWPRAVRQRMTEALGLRCARQRRRLASFCHEHTASLAKFADRQGAAEVAYLDADHTYYGDQFPWYALRELLRQKLDALGIRLVAREDGGATPLDTEVLNECESQNQRGRTGQKRPRRPNQQRPREGNSKAG
jgi:hypothetical protein